jgi:hypothetical protein
MKIAMSKLCTLYSQDKKVGDGCKRGELGLLQVVIRSHVLWICLLSQLGDICNTIVISPSATNHGFMLEYKVEVFVI